jgi:radical SAM protein (TIGR04043 family)
MNIELTSTPLPTSVSRSQPLALNSPELQKIMTELQSYGAQWRGDLGAAGRKGGAGPSDHKAVRLGTTTIMVPIFTDEAQRSPYTLRLGEGDRPHLFREGQALGPVDFPPSPQFYNLHTTDGIPYWKIALLHSHNVLATTVLQNCIRYDNRATACQFCAIGASLAADRTIATKTPDQLGEVAAAAARLDGVEQVVMTTGTPNTRDRGAAYLADCARGIKARVDLPIQAQCEPPDDFAWFARLKAAGVDSLGMHLEAADPAVRSRIMPGKARVPVDYYFAAFAAAVSVFGWGQVSTYLLAGLGDSMETLVETCERAIAIGVYPFVVPFVPITGTPLATHHPPSSDFMFTVYERVGASLAKAGMASTSMKAGCAKCGACSALSAFE